MSELLSAELKKAQKEVDRLVKNRGALFETMTDMIFLIREDFVIEDMNRSAIETFGDHRDKVCHVVLRNEAEPCSVCPVKIIANGEKNRGLIETKHGGVDVEYSYVPFQGYKGDRLVMVVMRDISERKLHEQEILEFNDNIEEILRLKIHELDESEKTRLQLAQEVNVLQGELERISESDEMVGKSKKIRELRKMVHQVAASDVTVLISGESGTGKELVADLIHRNSSRKDKPFLKFNCASVAESLLESDLFGYEKGAFTGANTQRKGKFEIADGATIFLDEIGDISPKMQANLLRVLQNGEIVRVGGTQPIRVNVRIVAATNKNLVEEVETGRFRQDLYYRLNVINLYQPPLRERKEDILPLVTHFVKKYRTAFKKDIDYIPNNVLDRLLTHDWPGNIRELENVMQRAVLLAKNNMITEKEMVFDLNSLGANFSSEGCGFLKIDDDALDRPLKETLAEVERQIMENVLEQCNGKMQEAASRLKIGKTAFYDKAKKYGIAKK